MLLWPSNHRVISLSPELSLTVGHQRTPATFCFRYVKFHSVKLMKKIVGQVSIMVSRTVIHWWQPKKSINRSFKKLMFILGQSLWWDWVFNRASSFLQITSHIQILFGVESALSLETVKHNILLAVWTLHLKVSKTKFPFSLGLTKTRTTFFICTLCSQCCQVF